MCACLCLAGELSSTPRGGDDELEGRILTRAELDQHYAHEIKASVVQLVKRRGFELQRLLFECFAGLGERVRRTCLNDVPPVPVTLHVYDVGRTRGMANANAMLSLMSTGIYHTAIEMYGLEWSFAFRRHGNGIFCCQPKQCYMHTYRQSLPLGSVKVSRSSLHRQLCRMARYWIGTTYSTLRKNCCHFCNELVQSLGLEPLPAWVMHMAGAVASISDALRGSPKQSDFTQDWQRPKMKALEGNSMFSPAFDREVDRDVKFCYMLDPEKYEDEEELRKASEASWWTGYSPTEPSPPASESESDEDSTRDPRRRPGDQLWVSKGANRSVPSKDVAAELADRPRVQPPSSPRDRAARLEQMFEASEQLSRQSSPSEKTSWWKSGSLSRQTSPAEKPSWWSWDKSGQTTRSTKSPDVLDAGTSSISSMKVASPKSVRREASSSSPLASRNTSREVTARSLSPKGGTVASNAGGSRRRLGANSYA